MCFVPYFVAGFYSQDVFYTTAYTGDICVHSVEVLWSLWVMQFICHVPLHWDTLPIICRYCVNML